MINRILIRLKVVQLLYSFFLTRSEFRIQLPPTKKSRDSRYSYRLYIDTLLLILRLTGRRTEMGQENPIKNPLTHFSEVAEALATNSDIREIIAKQSNPLTDYDDIIEHLRSAIADSTVYKDFCRKRKHPVAEQVKVWKVIIETIFAKDPKFKEACRRSEDFTIMGFNNGLAAAVETLEGYSDVKTALAHVRKSLDESLEQAYLLYHALLALPLEITRMRQDQLESAKEKYLPTSEDLNPNTKFIDNKFVEAIRASEQMASYFKDHPFSWESDYYMVRKLLDRILNSEIYTKYMADKNSSAEADCEFWREIFKDIILPGDELAETLESKSVYWNDDLNTIGAFVLKTIRRTAGEGENGQVCTLKLMPMFKDEEDEAFGSNLFTFAIDNNKEYRALIDRFINESHWDTERLALMDIVILTAAIAEIVNFPLIPIAVSLNEYIEIANDYSNPHSGQFINGILYSVVNYLRDEGTLQKVLEEKPRQ